ncbi:hypothetical protein ACEQUB_00919 [Ralstonia syzygii]|uniref:Uncharacterized protein n=1 Tax=Ralstonia syzygii R24 TaxID=907261 RepID=G3A624_9RALS|nr:conserved hypothetical protein [Ralstonia syzygii R24]
MSDDRPDGLHPSESLRTVDSLCEPDPRSLGFVRFDDSIGGFRSIAAADQLDDISQFTLLDEVPESVRIHFETAKNLYAYAWFVYRFHAVAEQHALTSLEFALRVRLAEELKQASPKRTQLPRGLHKWLEVALERGAISNDRISWRAEWALQRAMSRAPVEQILEMKRLGLTTMRVDYSTVQPSVEDLSHDWIGSFIDSLPKIRNAYAHGSELLHPTVLETFGIVCELVNQLFMPIPARVNGESIGKS